VAFYRFIENNQGCFLMVFKDILQKDVSDFYTIYFGGNPALIIRG